MPRWISAVLLSMALFPPMAPAWAETAKPSPAPEAAPGVQPPVSAQAPAKVKGGKTPAGLVCVMDTPTGSRFPVKVCTTAEQRKGERDHVRHAQDSLQGANAGVVPN